MDQTAKKEGHLSASQYSANDKQAPATILCVDDEKNVLSSLRRLFRPEGYNVIVAEGGKQGLAVLEKEKVDLIISDMRMPEMDGATFLTEAANRWPDTMRILLTGYADTSAAVKAINDGGIFKYLSKPWEENDIKLTVKRALEQKFLKSEQQRLEILTKKQNEELKDLNSNLESKVAERTKDVQRAMKFVQKANATLKKSYTDSIKVFASLVEMREGEHAGHSRRVAENAAQLAKKLGLDENAMQDIQFAALLHDLGKIGLADNLLQKPFNALTAEERKEVVKHPVLGEALLMALEPLRESAKFIRGHHERYDGEGYPDRLKDEEIPLGARILSVVSDYDSLIIGSFAQEKYSDANALKFIKENTGKRYDPKVAEVFIGLKQKDSSKAEGPKEIPIKTGGLKAGMVLSRDLIGGVGILLLAKDHILDDHIISKISKFELSLNNDLTIYIRTDGE